MKQLSSNARKIALISVTSLMTALVLAFTMIGINIGTGYVNLGDCMILTTAALFGPLPAAIAGGIGAMAADLIVFPATFAFTLVIKAAEGLVCGLLIRFLAPAITGNKHPVLQAAAGIISMLIAALIMVLGYFGTNVLFWGEGDSPATRLTGAVLQMPWDALQGVIGTAIAAILIYVIRLDKIAARFNIGKLVIRNVNRSEQDVCSDSKDADTSRDPDTDKEDIQENSYSGDKEKPDN